METLLYKRRLGPRDEEITQRDWVYEVTIANPARSLQELVTQARTTSVTAGGRIYYVVAHQLGEGVAPRPFVHKKRAPRRRAA